MSSWFSKLFRSRAETLAERAEVEGRFEEAARLYVEGGARAEAFRVLMRAAETSKHLADRRTFVTRAYAIARTDELKQAARKALGMVTLAEADATPPRTDEEKQRVREAATDLEATGAYREAARAYKLLADKPAIERVLMLAGDVEGYEQVADADADAERYALRRRNAIESCEALWRSGDRASGLAALDKWCREHENDGEARELADERRARLVGPRGFELRVNDESFQVVGALPVTFGREATVVVRGASVSREHCVIEPGPDGALVVRDNASRNGTFVQGVPLAGAIALATGQTVGLGSDLVLWVEDVTPGCVVLAIEKGMDRGKRVVLLRDAWPMRLGTVRFADGRAVLTPTAPVHLLGQRVVAPIALARGDRVEADGVVCELLR